MTNSTINEIVVKESNKSKLSPANYKAAGLPKLFKDQLDRGDEYISISHEDFEARLYSLTVWEIKVSQVSVILKMRLSWKASLLAEGKVVAVGVASTPQDNGTTWEYRSLWCKLKYPSNLFSKEELEGLTKAGAKLDVINGKPDDNGDVQEKRTPKSEELVWIKPGEEEDFSIVLADSSSGGLRIKGLCLGNGRKIYGGGMNDAEEMEGRYKRTKDPVISTEDHIWTPNSSSDDKEEGGNYTF